MLMALEHAKYEHVNTVIYVSQQKTNSILPIAAQNREHHSQWKKQKL